MIIPSFIRIEYLAATDFWQNVFISQEMPDICARLALHTLFVIPDKIVWNMSKSTAIGKKKVSSFPQ
jgi:hypothetical protein